MARIRGDILYRRKIKEIEEGEKQVRRLHIAQPILNNQENYDSEEDENESIYDDDDEEYDSDDNSEKEETDDDFHWSEICTNWIDLVNRENQFDNEEDNHLLDMAYNFLAAGRDSHPADDETAKWRLEYLFKENLKAPTFLGIEFNSLNHSNEM